MKAIAKRLRRLEDQFAPAERKPRDYFRIVLRRLDRIPGLEGASSGFMQRWPSPKATKKAVLQIRRHDLHLGNADARGQFGDGQHSLRHILRRSGTDRK